MAAGVADNKWNTTQIAKLLERAAPSGQSERVPPQDFDVVAEVSSLIDAWCERRELGPLARLLPAWIGNNGLTDGWGDVWEALRTVRADCRLPDAEALALDHAIVAVGQAVFRT